MMPKSHWEIAFTEHEGVTLFVIKPNTIFTQPDAQRIEGTINPPAPGSNDLWQIEFKTPPELIPSSMTQAVKKFPTKAAAQASLRNRLHSL